MPVTRKPFLKLVFELCNGNTPLPSTESGSAAVPFSTGTRLAAAA